MRVDLLGLYYDSLKNILESVKKSEDKKIWKDKLEKFIENTDKTFKKEICENGCIGGIAEIYDSDKLHLPKGTINQAWSVAEIFRIIMKR